MNRSKLLKIIVAILIAITLFIAFSQNSFASFVGNIDEKFDGKGDRSSATNEISGILSATINIVQIIGAGVAILMLIITGIRWVYASPEGKAQIAKTTRYYIMGAIFIFAAIGILQIIKNFSGGAFGSV